MSKSLPKDPSVRFLKIEAKDLLKAFHDNNITACRPFKLIDRYAGLTNKDFFNANVKLADAQYALALEYGYKSWRQLLNACKSGQSSHGKNNNSSPRIKHVKHLKHDPEAFFMNDNTIFGLYARKRWYGSDEAIPFFGDQMDNGSWNHSVVKTIENLYLISLFTESQKYRTDDAMCWLMEEGLPPYKRGLMNGAYDDLFRRTTRRDRVEMRKISGLPFTVGCSDFLKAGATLYLVVQFKLLKKGDVIKAFNRVEKISMNRNGRFCSGSCGNNMVQALAAHPERNKSEGMRRAILWIKSKQTDNGSWHSGIPFYPTLNALSKVTIPEAEDVYVKTLNRALRTQNKDGSWGRADKAFKAFMVIDAMERKGL